MAEKSRVLQLEEELSLRREEIEELQQCLLHSGPPPADHPEAAETLRLRERLLSASALKNYLDCGAKFYFATVRSLEVEEAVQESLDAGMMGNVFHKTM